MSSWRRHSRVISGVFVGGPDGRDRRGSSCPRAGQEARSEEGGHRRRAGAVGGSAEPRPSGRCGDDRTAGAVRFHDSVSERFPEGAERARVGAYHADDRLVEAHDRSGDALPAGRASRNECAPDACARDGREDGPEERNDKKKDAKPAAAPPTYPFEDVSFLELKPTAGQPLRITRGVAVPGGSYDLYVVMRERAAAGATPKAAVLKQPLDVPNYSSGEFTTSSVLLAERVEQLSAPVTPDQQSERPYAFGQQEVIVSPDHKFKKDQELIVLFQIYNPTLTDKKFNLEATYTFYQQAPDGEKKFNSTEPQAFTPESMGASFDPATVEQSIQAGQGIPLKSFPEGNYRLEIKVVDKLANPAKTLTQNVNFTVTP